MEMVNVSYNVNRPSIDDYNASYPKMPCNTPKKESLLNLVCEPQHIHCALVVVEETGASPVSYYEKKIQFAINSGLIDGLDWHEKQFVGTTTCVVMESNGWKKTGKKQRFSKGLFKSAEIYKKK